MEKVWIDNIKTKDLYERKLNKYKDKYNELVIEYNNLKQKRDIQLHNHYLSQIQSDSEHRHLSRYSSCKQFNFGEILSKINESDNWEGSKSQESNDSISQNNCRNQDCYKYNIYLLHSLI